MNGMALHWNPESRRIEVWNVIANQCLHTSYNHEIAHQIQDALEFVERWGKGYRTEPCCDLERSRLKLRELALAAIEGKRTGRAWYTNQMTHMQRFAYFLDYHREVFEDPDFNPVWTIPAQIDVPMPKQEPVAAQSNGHSEHDDLPF